MSRAWMPLYVADYLADTGHLSAAEHGAYLLLIMHYWQNGGLPNEDRRLARIARMSPDEWADSREVLFDLFDDGWSHHRIEAELKAAQEISEKAKEKAGKRWGKSRSNAEADAAAMPEHVPETCQSQSQSPTTPEPKGSGVGPAPKNSRGSRILPDWQPSERNRADAVAIGMPEAMIEPIGRRFRDFWTAKAGKDAVKLDWDATWRNWCSSEAERKGWAPSSPSHCEAAPGAQVFVEIHSEEWEAWQAVSPTKLKPFDTRHHGLGRYFPSRFPTPSQSKERAA
jgi:uncharacterized protein YdaU (DUF1376 family)